MVQSNEFKGATLAHAVRNATAAYDKKSDREEKQTVEVWRRRYSGGRGLISTRNMELWVPKAIGMSPDCV